MPKGDASKIFLLFTSMGYKQKRIDLLSIPTNRIFKVELEPSPLVLKAIKVTPEAIKIDKDTITYDVTSFKRVGDKTLAQVINRMPGISVSSRGKISIDGVGINKFYIEDMDLLGGRYAIALNNLDPNNIAKIQVYKKHQPIQILKEIEPSRQAAVNVKLKEK